VSRNVLREIGAEIVPSRLLLNKIDRISEADRAALRAKYPDAILLSAKSPGDVAALRVMIVAFFEAAMVEDQIVLPYAKQGLLGDVYETARVLSEDYDTTGRIMKTTNTAEIAPISIYARALQSLVAQSVGWSCGVTIRSSDGSPGGGGRGLNDGVFVTPPASDGR
jgi:hypothetical protein